MKLRMNFFLIIIFACSLCLNLYKAQMHKHEKTVHANTNTIVIMCILLTI